LPLPIVVTMIVVAVIAAVIAAIVIAAVNRGCHCTVSHRGILLSSPHSVAGIAIVIVRSCGPVIRP